MKITQEVRDIAAKQNLESDLTATAPVADPEVGMDEMSRVYNETGRELYIAQGDLEHDRDFLVSSRRTLELAALHDQIVSPPAKLDTEGWQSGLMR